MGKISTNQQKKVHGIEDRSEKMRMDYPITLSIANMFEKSLMGSRRLGRPSSEADGILMATLVCLETPLKTCESFSGFHIAPLDTPLSFYPLVI